MISPALEQLARDLAGQVKLVKVNVDASPQILQRFGVQAIPTLLVMRGGRVAAERSGVRAVIDATSYYSGNSRQTSAAALPALRTWVENALAQTAHSIVPGSRAGRRPGALPDRAHHWPATRRYGGADLGPPNRLVYLLDHECTQRSLNWNRLKGVDAERAALVRAAAERTGTRPAATRPR